jgi:hypothetical protein
MIVAIQKILCNNLITIKSLNDQTEFFRGFYGQRVTAERSIQQSNEVRKHLPRTKQVSTKAGTGSKTQIWPETALAAEAQRSKW